MGLSDGIGAPLWEIKSRAREAGDPEAPAVERSLVRFAPSSGLRWRGSGLQGRRRERGPPASRARGDSQGEPGVEWRAVVPNSAPLPSRRTAGRGPRVRQLPASVPRAPRVSGPAPPVATATPGSRGASAGLRPCVVPTRPPAGRPRRRFARRKPTTRPFARSLSL